MAIAMVIRRCHPVKPCEALNHSNVSELRPSLNTNGYLREGASSRAKKSSTRRFMGVCVAFHTTRDSIHPAHSHPRNKCGNRDKRRGTRPENGLRVR